MARQKRNQELNDEQRKVIVDNMGYARSIALNYKGRGAETEELIQVAYLALCEAVLRYDESSGASIVTYSTFCINGFLHKYLLKNVYRSYFTKGERQFAKMLSLDKHIDTGDDTVQLLDVVNADVLGREAERELILERIEKVMRCLKPDEIELIECRFNLYGEVDLLEEIHKKKYGDISLSQLYRRCDAILNKMIDYAEKANL